MELFSCRPFSLTPTEFPMAWDLEVAYTSSERDDASSGSEDEEPHTDHSASSKSKSLACQEFLQFLQLGCSGSPLQGYPAVVVILSTIPTTILASSTLLQSSPWEDFFASFWAAIDGRALSSLERAATSAAFLSSLLECTTFLTRRLLREHTLGEGGPGEKSCNIIAEQYRRVWEELLASRLRTEDGTAGMLLAKNLIDLYQTDDGEYRRRRSRILLSNRRHLGIFHTTWEALSTAIKDPKSSSRLSLIATVTHTFMEQFQDGTGPKTAALSLMNDILQESVTRCENTFKNGAPDVDDVQPVASLLHTFKEELFHNNEFARVRGSVYIFLPTSQQFPSSCSVSTR
jgi:E3 ubiquitin-protein ligase listerin